MQTSLSTVPVVKTPSCKEETVYVFQGGGALGAYQVGIIRGLREKGYSPNWVVGTSIGAINASIIAGNPYESRLKKLNQFWEKILWKIPHLHNAFFSTEWLRRWQNHLSAQLTLWFGLPGFFSPHYSLSFLPQLPDKISFYETQPLRDTLEELIDFDYLNKGEVRLSLGAVDIQSGEMVYFDNSRQTILPEHIMASGALPPGFPAIEIEGRFYWDGGLYSNTPLDYVLQHKRHKDTLCFIIQLMGPDDQLPTNIDQIEKRKKEISFGSRYKEHLALHQKMQGLRHIIRLLGEKMPAALRAQPEIADLLKHAETHTLEVVHFCAPNLAEQLSSKDYEFSHASAQTLIDSGHADALHAIQVSPWHKPLPAGWGVRLHEMGRKKSVE